MKDPLDVFTTQAARRYGYLLGGKDNFAADRRAAGVLAEAFPGVGAAVRENRKWVERVVQFLAADCGMHRFLDFGVGLPQTPNVHEVAQRVDPDAVVAYVDHDDVVAVHARALLATDARHTSFAVADLRHRADVDTVLRRGRVGEWIRRDQPFALLLGAVLHFLTDADNPHARLTQIIRKMPPGSYVALSHVSLSLINPDSAAALAALAADPGSGQGPFRARSREEIGRFLDGLELVEPGLVPVTDWYADRAPEPAITAEDAAFYAVVARKP